MTPPPVGIIRAFGRLHILPGDERQQGKRLRRLRAEADVAGHARPIDNSAVIQLVKLLTSPSQSIHAPHRAFVYLAEAEHHRLAGQPSPGAWQHGVDTYEAMGARYLALYPQWRAAEAHLTTGDRGTAADLLRRPPTT